MQTIINHIFSSGKAARHNLASSQSSTLDLDALGDIFYHLTIASKALSWEINRAGVAGHQGFAGTANTTGDDQKKFDVYADELFISVLRNSTRVAGVATEENETIIPYTDSSHADGRYFVYLDPVDGSSNLDVNVSVGTNFAIFKTANPGTNLQPTDYLQPGRSLVAAGYVVYGASTMLVYSLGNGVHGFTLDQSIGEFVLSHPEMKFPTTPTYYSINESYAPLWTAPLRQLIDSYKTRQPALNTRWVGALVADFHRNLIDGGVFLFPANANYPNGKLRLMYEGIPFAYLAEQAGGTSSDGTQNILDIQPTGIHQRTPLFLGNQELVLEINAKATSS
jgi:fructose-1,6-bisphosphatase I